MAVGSVLYPTLVDAAKLLNPDGSVANVVEILSQQNDILEEMVWVEANGPVSHRTTIRSGLPAATWRKLNYGVQPTKATTVQVTDTIGDLEAYSDVDKALTDLAGDPIAFRYSEDAAHIEGMRNELFQTLIYGNEGTEPEAFTGLTPRYNLSTAENGLNVIKHGGVGADNASIWLIVWGPNTVHGIYPKGSMVGLEVEDKGQVTLLDAADGKYEGYETHFVWKAGLCVRDWRYAVRICNIDASDLATLTNTDEVIVSMIRALERVPNLNAGRPAFYMNRAVREAVRLGANEKASSQITVENVAGQPVMRFGGVPVRRCDALTIAEDLVS